MSLNAGEGRNVLTEVPAVENTQAEAVIEAAKKTDARALAHLINIAGEGIPEYFWSDMLEAGDTPLDVGERRAARDEGGFSYRNARVLRRDGEVAGMIIAYRQPEPYDLSELLDYPAVIQPLLLLEAEAPGSYYINALATQEAYRGQGIATALIEEAEERAEAEGVSSMSIIVASENTPALSLYQKLGYHPVAARKVVPYPSAMYGGEWELLVKPLI